MTESERERERERVHDRLWKGFDFNHRRASTPETRAFCSAPSRKQISAAGEPSTFHNAHSALLYPSSNAACTYI